MKVLILGAGGFIGVNLTERLLQDGVHHVIAVDINPAKMDDLLLEENRKDTWSPKLRYIHQDIANDEAMIELVQQADVVLDLVAFANPSLYVDDPLGVYDLNFVQNMKIVHHCRVYKKRLIQFSTCEVYGISAAKAAEQFGLSSREHKCEFAEDTTPLIMGPVKNHRWIYACSKQLLERILFALGKSEDFPFTIIRPFNFVGPRIDYLPSEEAGNPRVFSHFMDSLLYGTKPMMLVDGGTAWRSYTYISDAVDCIVRIIEDKDSNCNGQIFNIGQPENELQIKDMAVKMCDIFDTHFRTAADPPRPEIVSISGEEFYGKGYEDCDRRIPNIDKAKSLLGWSPTYDIDAVLTKTMEYFVKEHRKKQARQQTVDGSAEEKKCVD
jgi:nucleoside-diphosphate-sugar epimerase